jgi:hypothetical protein
MIATSNAQRRRGHAPKFWRSHVVAKYAAESLKFEHNSGSASSLQSSGLVPSSVALADCSKGGTPNDVF